MNAHQGLASWLPVGGTLALWLLVVVALTLVGSNRWADLAGILFLTVAPFVHAGITAFVDDTSFRRSITDAVAA